MAQNVSSTNIISNREGDRMNDPHIPQPTYRNLSDKLYDKRKQVYFSFILTLSLLFYFYFSFSFFSSKKCTFKIKKI